MEKGLSDLIIKARNDGFGIASDPHLYGDLRGLERRSEYQGYLECLPTYNGETFSQIVDRKVREAAGANPVRILDLGCGRNATFLRDCLDRWGSAVFGIGIGARIQIPPNERKEMRINGIDIRKADVQFVDSIVEKVSGPESIDIAVSCQVFQYLPDPYMTVVGVNQVLKPDGVALISDGVPVSQVIEGPSGEVSPELVKSFLYDMNRFGIETIDSWFIYKYGLGWVTSLAFSKVSDLRIPLVYSGKTKEIKIPLQDDGTYTFNVLTYIYKGNSYTPLRCIKDL